MSFRRPRGRTGVGGGLGGRFQSGRKHWHLIYYHRDKYPLALFLLNIVDGSFYLFILFCNYK